jgi:hypothetical protein
MTKDVCVILLPFQVRCPVLFDFELQDSRSLEEDKLKKESYFDSRLQIFTTVKIHIMVFWVMILCHDTVGYHCFKRALLPSSSEDRDMRGAFYFSTGKKKTVNKVVRKMSGPK